MISAWRRNKAAEAGGIYNMSPAVRFGVITGFGYVVPERRVKLILRLHDLGEESGLTFFIKRGITTESARKRLAFIIKKGL